MSAFGSIFPLKKLTECSPRATVAAAFCLSLAPFLIVELFRAQFFRILDVPSYLVFHNIAEFFSIMVSLSIFGVGWFTYAQTRDRHALFLGAAFLATGLMDFMHTLSYAGMPAFISPNSANKSTQFWIVVRFIGALSFLISAYIHPDSRGRWLSKTSLATAVLAVSAAAFAGIVFFPSYMPATFIQGVGLTPFKIVSEYLIICLLIFATAAYWRRAWRTGNGLLNYYIAAFVVCIFSELSFAVYMSVFDTFNVLGHLYKVVGYLLIYKGIFITSVQIPYVGLADAGEKLRQNVLERERAEKALQLSSTYNRSLIEASLDPLVTIDAAGKIMDVNSATEKVTGYPRGGLIGTEFSGYFTEPERARAGYEQVFQEGSVQNYELEIRHRDGSVTPVLYNASVYRDESGKVLGVFAAARDISERKQVEESLRESEQKYRALVANADEAIFIAQDEVVKFPNSKMLEMTGYSTEELAGVPFTDLIHPEDRGTVLERHIDRLRGGTPPATYPFRILKKKTDEAIWVQLTAVLIDWEGRPGVLCFLRDMTKERYMEAQFMQAQKMEAVGRLAGGIAHDFNNLLTVTIGYCDLALTRVGAQDPLRHDLEEIRKASDRCTVLTRQLLAFSRKQILAPKVINLGDVVLEMDKMLRRLIGEDIDLVFVRGKDLWNVKTDPGQIEQIIMNLVVNSRDAMPNGGKLTIETSNVVLDETYTRGHQYVSPGSYVMLAVSDTGSGMDEGTLSRIFEPFFTTKEEGKGTGLGLSTVYGIVKQSGGHINVYSEPGIGTTFKMYFPRVEETVTGISRPASLPLEELRGSETILVVEDEELVRAAVREILAQYGYTVLEARSGGEAVDLCTRHRGTIHLMLTDVVMPGMNGVELSKRLAPMRPDMKVLFMSGYTANAIVHQGILEEGIAFIHKPFSMDSLAHKVREVLDKA